MFAVLVSCLLVTLLFGGKGNIPPVRAFPGIYQGDLLLAGNNITFIEGVFNINGSIIIEENAALYLKDAFVNLWQARGSTLL